MIPENSFSSKTKSLPRKRKKMSTPAMLAIVLYVGPRLGVAEMSQVADLTLITLITLIFFAIISEISVSLRKKTATPRRGPTLFTIP